MRLEEKLLVILAASKLKKQCKTIVVKRRQTMNVSRCARWRHMDTNRDKTGDWNIAPPALTTEKSPCSLFKEFFTDKVNEFISLETVRYAHSKEKHNFELFVDKQKFFFAILLLSGYMVLLCRPMY